MICSITHCSVLHNASCHTGTYCLEALPSPELRHCLYLPCLWHFIISGHYCTGHLLNICAEQWMWDLGEFATHWVIPIRWVWVSVVKTAFVSPDNGFWGVLSKAPLRRFIIGTDSWKDFWVAPQKGYLNSAGSLLSQARPGGSLKKREGTFWAVNLWFQMPWNLGLFFVPALKRTVSFALWEGLIGKAVHRRQETIPVYRCGKQLGFCLCLDVTHFR